MKTIDDIRKEAVAEYTGRAVFKDIAPEDLVQNIADIATFVAIRTAELIKETTLEKTLRVLDTEFKREDQLQSYFDDLLKHNDIVSIDQVGKHLFAISIVKHAPDLV